MALIAQQLKKAREITAQTADQYQEMYNTMTKLNSDAFGRVQVAQATLAWDLANPNFLDPQVVIETQQFLDYMIVLGDMLATVPPVPNM